MSIHSPSKNRNQPALDSQDQDSYIRSLMAQKKSLEEQKVQKYKSILQKTYAMEQTAANVNVNLKEQTQKLQNIHTVTEQTGKLTKKANQTSKQLSSFWYSLGKKIVKIFVKKQDSQEDPNSIKPTQIDSTEPNTHKETEKFEKCPNQTTSQLESDNIDDHYMDELLNQVGKLKFMAKSTNGQLTKHIDLVNKIDAKIDKNSQTMEQANKRIKKNFL